MNDNFRVIFKEIPPTENNLYMIRGLISMILYRFFKPESWKLFTLFLFPARESLFNWGELILPLCNHIQQKHVWISIWSLSISLLNFQLIEYSWKNAKNSNNLGDILRNRFSLSSQLLACCWEDEAEYSKIIAICVGILFRLWVDSKRLQRESVLVSVEISEEEQ